MTVQRRWVCPACQGGVLGPQRPRKDDVRRYCLKCSAKTGRLVERSCPALEKSRAAAREATRARIASQRTRAAATAKARRTVGDVDLLDEAQRLWKLPALRDASRSAPLPAIEIRRRKTARTSGSYGWGRDVVVTAGTDVGSAVEIMLHELVHAALGVSEGHSIRFWQLLRAAAKEAWPEVDFRFHEAPERGYVIDRWIRARLKDTECATLRGVAPAREEA